MNEKEQKWFLSRKWIEIHYHYTLKEKKKRRWYRLQFSLFFLSPIMVLIIILYLFFHLHNTHSPLVRNPLISHTHPDMFL
ncbi:hypothetical protein VNO80_05356 [Phaseolus coccineus]|uniref:Uncharacterized protein n=1 Tax=Phaseolus coccineus TaxID=3886 RepID=A0AAN9RHT1_PHACN